MVFNMTQYDEREGIGTDRLFLKRFKMEDLEAYTRIMGDRNVGKWFPKGNSYTREESEESLRNILNHWDKNGFGIWAIVDKGSGVLIGRCGLNLIAETSEVEVDFVVASDSWGRRYATEAAKAALAYGFEKLKLDRIIALAKPDNTASRRVIEKLGMRYLKNAEYWGITCAYYTVSRSQYEIQRHV